MRDKEKLKDKEAEIAERLVDGSFVSRAIFAACRKAGPYSLVVIVALWALFYIKWPEKEAGEGIETSLVDRHFRDRQLDEARQLLVQKDVAGAAGVWKDLLRKYPSDIRLYRGLLDAMGESSSGLVTRFEDADAIGARLLGLGRTNRDDLVRVVRLHAALGNWPEVKSLAGDVSTNFTADVGAILARAYFESNDLSSFEQFWVAFQPEFSALPALKPWRLAADAVEKEGEEGERARRELGGLRGDPDQRVLALRLLARVALMKADASAHAILLQEMLAAKVLRPSDWIEHVELLARLGRMEEARAYSERIDEVRGRADELSDVVLRLFRRGLRDPGMALLNRSLKVVGKDMTLAVAEGVGAFLMSDWGKCNSIAFSLRGQQPTAGVADAIAYFLEGCAAEGLGYGQKAKASFDEMELVPSAQPRVVLDFAGVISSLGVSTTNTAAIFRSWRLVKSLEGSLSTDAAYWRERSVLARRANQAVDMVSSARAAMDLHPAAPHSRSSLAQALMLSPGNEAEVARLTAGLMKEFPVLPEWRLQHAMALAAGGSVDEAKRMLGFVSPNRIPPRLDAMHRLAWLHVHIADKQWGAARKVLGEIRAMSMDRMMTARIEDLAGRLPND